MYESHHGLIRRPYVETVDPSAYVPLPGHEGVLRRLRYALEHSHSPAALHGPPGSGKTLLARVLAKRLGRPAVHLTFPALPAADLVAMIAEELGERLTSRSWSDSLRLLRERLSGLAAQGLRPLLVVDETQSIRDPSVLDALRLLLNFNTDGSPDLALLLVGETEFLLDLPSGLADRLAARCPAGPVSVEESSAYIVGRIAAARPDRDHQAAAELFSPAALATLAHHGDGLPRRLNRLADLALLIAYARELPRVDEETAAIAVREYQQGGIAA